MAIQMRRGQLSNYDKTKMLAGEWGISIDADTNDQKAYMAFAPGVDKEVMFVEDAEAQIAVATAAAIADATEESKAWARGNSFHINDFTSGNGSTRAFTLTYTPTSIISVYVDGTATSAYTLSGNTITFSTAPPSGTNNIRVNYTVSTQYDNSKYYKEQAASSASSASSSASTATSKASTATTKASEASTSATNASNSASSASTSATTATNQRKEAEAWAVGKKDGTDVPSTAQQYHNNAKYWADEAAASASQVINVDTAMSDSSRNAVENRVIKSYVDANVNAVKAVRVNMGTISSLPTTKAAVGVTSDMVLAKADLGTPSAQTSSWTVTTGTDTITISSDSGTGISGTTTLTLLLESCGEITAT